MVVQQVKRSGRRVSSGGDGDESRGENGGDLQELREEDGFKVAEEEEFQLSLTSICCYFWKKTCIFLLRWTKRD